MQTPQENSTKKKSVLAMVLFAVFALAMCFIIGTIIFLAPIIGPHIITTEYGNKMRQGLETWDDDRAEAEKLIQSAIALAKDKKAPIAEQMQMRRDYARKLYNSGEGEEGDKQEEEAIAMCPKPPGKNSNEANVLTHAYQDIGNDKLYRHTQDESLPVGLEEQEKSYEVAKYAFGPEHEQTIYKMALLPVMYQLTGDSKKAHAVMDECKIAVTKPSAKECEWYVYALDTRLAELEHDNKRALESFTRALSAPTDDKDRIWSELQQGLPPDTEDYPFSDVLDLFKKKNYAKLDKIFDEVQKAQTENADGSWALDTFITALLDEDSLSDADYQQRIFDAKTWLKKEPHSKVARLLLANLYINYAWLARGHEYADSVKEQGWKNFEKRMALAKSVLDEEPDLKNQTPKVYTAYSAIAQCQSMPKAQYLVMIDECHKKWQHYYRLDQSACNYLLPRWFGAPLDVEKFIEKRANELGGKEGDKVYAQLVWREHTFLDNLFTSKSPINWARVKRGFKEIFSRFPKNREAKETFLTLCQQANDPGAVAIVLGLPEKQ